MSDYFRKGYQFGAGSETRRRPLTNVRAVCSWGIDKRCRQNKENNWWYGTSRTNVHLTFFAGFFFSTFFGFCSFQFFLEGRLKVFSMDITENEEIRGEKQPKIQEQRATNTGRERWGEEMSNNG